MLRSKMDMDSSVNIKELMNSSSVKITKCNELVHDLENEVCKYTKLLELAKQDRLETISHEVCYNDFNYCFDDIEIVTDFNKRKNSKTHKQIYDFIEEKIGDIIGKDSVNITKMMFEGYDNYNLSIYFIVADYPFTFELRVPNMKQIKEHFKYMNFGKLTLFYEDKPNIWEFIYASYDEEEFKDVFEKFINNRIGD